MAQKRGIKMEITLTIREIMDKGLWEEYCDIINGCSCPFCKTLAELERKIILTEKEIDKLGFNKLFF